MIKTNGHLFVLECRRKLLAGESYELKQSIIVGPLDREKKSGTTVLDDAVHNDSPDLKALLLVAGDYP